MLIQSTKDIVNTEKFRFMIYGNSGIGKTQLIGTVSGTPLVLNTDKGMKTLTKSTIDFVSANTWPEVVEFLQFMKTKECQSKYDWIVFDSVSAMMDLLFVDLQDNKKLTGFDLWREYGNFVTKFLRVLRDQQDYHTLSIFECMDKEDESGKSVKAFAVQGQVGGRIPNFYDEVFALRLDKSGNRILQTNSVPGWISKDRSQLLAPIEPADLSLIMKKLRNEKL